jgi:hypothetical protein
MPARKSTPFSVQPRKPINPMMKRRQEHLDHLKKYIGDDKVAGLETPWAKLEVELRRLTERSLRSLSYRVERAVEEGEKNAVEFEKVQDLREQPVDFEPDDEVDEDGAVDALAGAAGMR